MKIINIFQNIVLKDQLEKLYWHLYFRLPSFLFSSMLKVLYLFNLKDIWILVITDVLIDESVTVVDINMDEYWSSL